MIPESTDDNNEEKGQKLPPAFFPVSCSAVECIVLPVFSIHGNHDDPIREGGGTEPLAALDLLAASNLVNYFGRQDQVDKVEVAPVLFQKGSSHVALYGMGSLCDERVEPYAARK